jgi:hypothetical protein
MDTLTTTEVRFVATETRKRGIRDPPGRFGRSERWRIRGHELYPASMNHIVGGDIKRTASLRLGENGLDLFFVVHVTLP